MTSKRGFVSYNILKSTLTLGVGGAAPGGGGGEGKDDHVQEHPGRGRRRERLHEGPSSPAPHYLSSWREGRADGRAEDEWEGRGAKLSHLLPLSFLECHALLPVSGRGSWGRESGDASAVAGVHGRSLSSGFVAPLRGRVSVRERGFTPGDTLFSRTCAVIRFQISCFSRLCT